MEKLIELSFDDLVKINGGSELSNTIGYWIGRIARILVDNMPETPPNMGRL